VRIVEVPGVDSCACCGIHVGFTGEIGLVKIFSCVKFHQGVRLEMACGKRAMDYLTAVFEENRQVSQAFSAKILETGAAARRMNEVLAADKFRITGLERRLFDSIAQGYVNQVDVLHFEQDLEPVSVRELADRVAACCTGKAAVFSGNDETGYSFCLATREGDLRPFAKEMTASLNGRGGGKPGFIQGSVKASREKIQAFFSK
jgi:alanyl-tRNA synthetase